jgi:hypothetical protein
LPTNGAAGDWRAEISRKSGNAAVPYHMSVYTFEAKFSSRFDFTTVSHGTGDDIILTATLGFGGLPLTGQAGGLKVQVERPASALSTVLHQANTPISVLTTPVGVSADSYSTPYDRKLLQLLETTGLGQAIDPKPDPQLVTLFDDGDPAHGDAVAGDGVYSMRYGQTRIPGRYRFKIAMNATTPSGPVNRIEQRDAEVQVLKIDAAQSEVNSTKDITIADKYRIDIVPADRFGNFLGPGYTDQIKVTLVGPGTVSTPVVDERENGTYTVELTGVTAPATTRVQVSYLGQTFADKTVRDAGKAARPFAVFFGIGGNFPHGPFSTAFNSGVSARFGFEYMFTNRVSVEGTLGYDRFASAFSSNHLNLVRGSGNLKFYPVIGTFQFGVFGGGGVYHFDSGGGTHGGVNIGAVGEIRLNTSVSIESNYNFHNVFTSGSSTRFSTLQGGIRFRF